MPDLFFFLSRLAVFLLIFPLCAKFQGAKSPRAFIGVFARFTDVERIGVITIVFILLATTSDLAFAFGKVIANLAP
jgi:hypothetical protein